MVKRLFVNLLIFLLFFNYTLIKADFFSYELYYNKRIIKKSEPFILQAEIKGDFDPEKIEEFNLPSTNYYRVLSIEPSISKSYSIVVINGKKQTQRNISLTYYISIIFLDTGVVHLKGPSFIYKGKRYKFKDIDVIVKGNNQNITKTPTFYFHISLDKKKLYVGEYAELTIKFGPRNDITITRIDLGNLDSLEYNLKKVFLVKPLFKDNKDIEKTKKKVDINGYMYTIYTLKYILYPIKDTTVYIGPLFIRYAQLVNNLWIGDINRVARSNKIKVYVKSLKEELPVGVYTISSNIDKHEVNLGEGLTLTIKISGYGNIRLLKKQELQDDNFQVFPPEVDYSTIEENGRLKSIVTFKYLLIPKYIGKIKIPSLSFLYYNTQKEKIDTLKTKSFNIVVKSASDNDSNKALTTITYSKKRKVFLNNKDNYLQYIKKGDIDIEYLYLSNRKIIFFLLLLLMLNFYDIFYMIVLYYKNKLLGSYTLRLKKALIDKNLSDIEKILYEIVYKKIGKRNIPIDILREKAEKVNFVELSYILSFIEELNKAKYIGENIDDIFKSYKDIEKMFNKIVSSKKWKEL